MNNPDFLKRYKIGDNDSDEENDINNDIKKENNSNNYNNGFTQNNQVRINVSSNKNKIQMYENPLKRNEEELLGNNNINNNNINSNNYEYDNDYENINFNNKNKGVNKETEDFLNSYKSQIRSNKLEVYYDNNNKDNNHDIDQEINQSQLNNNYKEIAPINNHNNNNLDASLNLPSSISISNNNNYNEVKDKKYHHVQIIDEDVENFKRRLDIMVKNFRADSLNDFMSIKRNLLSEQKTVIENEKQKFESILSTKTNQIENLKEALSQTKQQLLQEAEMKERLSLQIFKIKNSKKQNYKKKEAFEVIKSNFLFTRKSNKLINTIRTNIVEYNLKRKLFKLFVKDFNETKTKRIICEKEDAMNLQIKDISVKYNKEINDLRIKLNEANITIGKYRDQRNAIQENLKKTLMRGVVAMNFEAMNILDADGELINVGVGNEGNVSTINNNTGNIPSNNNNNNINNNSISLSTSQIHNMRNISSAISGNPMNLNYNTNNNTEDINNSYYNTGRFINNNNINNINNAKLTNNNTNSYNNVDNSTNLSINKNLTNTINKNSNIIQPNNNNIDTSFNTNTSVINNKDNNKNNITNITNSSYIVEQLENKAVSKDSNWVNACSVPTQMKNNMIIKENEGPVINFNKPEYDEDKPYNYKSSIPNMNYSSNINNNINTVNTNISNNNYNSLKYYNSNLNNINSDIKHQTSGNNNETYGYEELTKSK